MLKEILPIIGTIVLVILVFWGAYIVSKFVGKHYNPQYNTSKNIRIIESMVVGKDKTLMVIEIAGKVMLVGVTAKEFTMLTELDSNKLTYEPNSINNQSDFLSTLKNVVKGRNKNGEGEKNR